MICFARPWLESGSRAFTGHREFVAEANNRLNSAWDITDLPPYRSDVTSTNCWPTCTTSQASYGGSFSPFHLREVIDVLRGHFLRLFRTVGTPRRCLVACLVVEQRTASSLRSKRPNTRVHFTSHCIVKQCSSCFIPGAGEHRRISIDFRRFSSWFTKR